MVKKKTYKLADLWFLKPYCEYGSERRPLGRADPTLALRHLVFRNFRKAFYKLFLQKGLDSFLAIVSKLDKNEQEFQ